MNSKGIDMANARKRQPKPSSETEARDDPHTRPVTDAVLSAIADSGLNINALARATGCHASALRIFVRRNGDLSLAAADKVAGSLGLKAARDVPTPLPKARDAPHTRPITEALLSAIDDSGLSAYALSKATGLSNSTIRRFVRREVDLTLKPADKLFSFLGLKTARDIPTPLQEAREESPTRPITEALLSAIDDSGLDTWALSRATGLTCETIRRFVRRERELQLASADKLFSFLRLKVARKDKAFRPEPKLPIINPLQPLLDELRLAIADSELSPYAIAKRADVPPQTVTRFLNGKSRLEYVTIIKLATALELNWQSASLKVSPTRRCPVELQGKGRPILVNGKKLPDMKGDAYKMLDRIINDFKRGLKTPVSELAALSESGRIRPLTDALDRPGFKPLRRLFHESKEGRNKFIEIKDLDPGD
jgi:plasmid maintenance system antidote protein VapI